MWEPPASKNKKTRDMVDSQGQYGGSWFCSYYSQLSRKRPPLVQDKVVAYEKNKQLSPLPK